MIDYPEEFKIRCKALYPDFTRLHNALDKGSQMVGRYLEDGTSQGIPLATILDPASTLEHLQNLARRQQRLNKLYTVWCEIYRKWARKQPEVINNGNG